MDDTPAKETPGENINKLDLSALEAFQFGTQWTDAGDAKRTGDRGHEARQRPGGDAGPAARRDRRPARRTESPEGAPEPSYPPTPSEQAPRRGDFPPRDTRPPMRQDRDDRAQRERFERDRPDRGERFERGPRFERGGPRRPAGPPRPYVSPVFELTFYPDDHGFNALVKAMRASSRTYELFEIARLILGKLERCVVVFRRLPDETGKAAPLSISVPDGLPFPTEEEAISHALEVGLAQFFTMETVEVEPPKGTFQFVNRCPITKDLLGPPNYHRYPQILQHHYTARGIHMPFEKYKAMIEVVRDPEAVNAWLESMKKATRYTLKGESPEGPKVFDNVEDARAFLLRVCRDRIVRTGETARLSAKVVEGAGRSEASHAMLGALETQRRFPLDTANALRGRLRRENFHIFKRGSKGITYVCSVRRKFRQPGQSFSDSINRLIDFLEKNPLTPVSELASRMLGINPPAPPEPAATPAATAAPAGEEVPQAPAPAIAELTSEQKTALSRLAIDLRWLVTEGYVAEYSDGRLFVHPVVEPDHPHPDAAGHEAEGTAEEGTAPEAAATAESEPAPESPQTEAQPEVSPVSESSGAEPPPDVVATTEPATSDTPVEPATEPTPAQLPVVEPTQPDPSRPDAATP